MPAPARQRTRPPALPARPRSLIGASADRPIWTPRWPGDTAPGDVQIGG